MDDEEYTEYGEERGYYDRVSKDTGFISSEDVKNLTEEEKMFRSINIIVGNISKLVKDKLGNQDLEYLKEIAVKIGDNIKYRNLTAYILGYYCTKDKKDKINNEKFQELKEILEDKEDVDKGNDFLNGIMIEDVLRYSNYWTKQLINFKEDD